jgi:dihydroorotate dehydrogenase electron transfer subunit
MAFVVHQQRLAEQTFRLRLHCPDVARTIVPGQFFMIRPAGGTDPLLGRPFALYDTVLDDQGRPESLDCVYHVIGKMTGLMSRWTQGEPVELWGPLGNGFPAGTRRHLVFVGGGIGYTPSLAVAREVLQRRDYGLTPRRSGAAAARFTLCYGVRTAAQRADLSDFASLPEIQVQIATEDGSEGHRGLVTEPLQALLRGESPPDAVFCCGPVPMMQAVARLCEASGVDCWLSLESPMACGFGACFSCVTRVRTDDPDGWDYRRTCVEGPVFHARELMLD